ncbi:MAG TPA: endo alpha-1,4 polygalactosaminidase [Kofleriaceae bacterium]|jgi:hypothetical protein|nr:endo alpha-1,4 polygalactosaminidase [Kofleriaceae bacterium]
MTRRFVVAAVGVLTLVGCRGSSGDDSATDDAATNGDGNGNGDGSGSANVTLPPLDGKLDYQLGGAYTPPTGVTIVSRDREASTAAGIYNICYVNGFQIQQAEESFWTGMHADLILRDGNGNPVIDPDWNEMLIDVSTPAKQQAVAAIVGGWIEGCATAGFNAVEIDNLDSYSRSGGRLTEDNAVATMKLFSLAAHARSLAIAQKNSSEIVSRKSELGTDFVVAEECNRYSECDTYRGGYGDHVLVIEYRQQDFTAGCAAYPALSIVLRDLNLVTPSQSGYLYDGC